MFMFDVALKMHWGPLVVVVILLIQPPNDYVYLSTFSNVDLVLYQIQLL